MRSVSHRRTRDDGASAVEYAILVAGIAAVIIAIVFVIGHYVHGTYSQTCDSFSASDPIAGAGTCS